MSRKIYVMIVFLFCVKSKVDAIMIEDSESARLLPAIMFPVGSGTGILVVVAVPVALPDQNVFVSVN